MTESSRGKFMKAVFGKDGTTIETSTAAALLAATYSGGDPQIGENIAQLLVPEMGDTVDQSMMAALMSSSSMINAGASTEEVSRQRILRARLGPDIHLGLSLSLGHASVTLFDLTLTDNKGWKATGRGTLT